ncbi:MAG TPA: hypothetical protein IAB31_03420 [Candidatus Choladousia intestinavium]|uniref:Uncharacterized protein n=1 Tax=Candidatus Choladousia intestinavium TaxID=2840727 RepID=A0A9D1AAJ7_9FIRM|nr:hypothetical protein [Candidatus Choladousia intestinavium]
MSMRDLEQNAEGLKTRVKEKVKEAQEMRQEVEAFKAELSGMPGGLDAEIVSAIRESEEQGRQEAISDIDNVERQADQDQQEGQRVQSEVDSKIQENNTAAGKLESARGNKYGKGVEGAIRSIETNNAQGEQIKSGLEAAMQEAMSDLNTAKSGI